MPSTIITSSVLAASIVFAAPASAIGSNEDDTTMAVWDGICNAAGTLHPVISALCKVTDAVVKLAEPTDPSIREVFNRVVSLELNLQRLGQSVADLSFEQRREEALSLARAIDTARGSTTAALAIAADHPGDTAAQVGALAAAHALERPTFYTLPGRTIGAADRFDPRAALPTFVIAVDAWVAIHKSANIPWTDTSRQEVAAFSGRLLEIVDQMRASIHCEEVWHDFQRVARTPSPPRTSTGPRPVRGCGSDPTPDPNPTTEAACNHRLSCTDEMQAETTAIGQTTPGICQSHTSTNAQANLATRIADYQLERYREIARAWRVAAQLP